MKVRRAGGLPALAAALLLGCGETPRGEARTAAPGRSAEPVVPDEPGAASGAEPPAIVPHGGDPGAFGPPPPPGLNLLVNPSFEDRVAPWYLPIAEKELWREFSIDPELAADGEHSVSLSLDSRDFGERKYGVFGPSQGATGIRQDLVADRMPRFLRLRYRLERWVRGTAAQYFQVVVGVSRAANLGLLSKEDVETAFVLGGVDRVPVDARLRRFVFLGPRDPEELAGGWREVEVDLHARFQEEWLLVPADFELMWVTFEARFDSKVDHRARHLEVEVLADDFYLGH